MSIEEIKYKPQNLKDVLKEMKDTSELMVDLAYSAVLFENEDIAEEVLRLEERMDVLGYHVRISAMLGARRVEEAEELSGVLQIAAAAEKVSNAAGDIAKIVLTDVGLPERLGADMPEAEETVTRVHVKEGSSMDAKILGDLQLETETGMKVIAIRQDLEWTYDPDRDTMLMREDVLFARGPENGISALYKLATGEEYAPKEPVEYKRIDDLDKAVDLIIDMKNLSELAVGLAYSAVLFYSKEIANEVKLLEATMDNMKSSLEHWTLEAAKHVENVDQLRGLLHLAISSEVISDAAYEIADVVLRDIELHPVFMLAIRESDEVITRVDVQPGSEIANKTLGELGLETHTGMFVMAVRREDKPIYHPDSKTEIRAGDSLIAKGTRSGEEIFMNMCLAPA